MLPLWLAMLQMFWKCSSLLFNSRRSQKFKSYLCNLGQRSNYRMANLISKRCCSKRFRIGQNKSEVSILFGREDRGLTNEELQLANKHLIIPAHPDYPVLNIAMSTQVVCYEIYQAAQNHSVTLAGFSRYTSEELNHLIEHFNETVQALIVDPKNPKQIHDQHGKNVSKTLPRSDGRQFSKRVFKS